MPRLRLSRLVRLASLHVAAVVVAASLAFPRSSTAQAPCNRACDAAQRDVNGCCSAAPPSQDKTSATTMPCRPGMAQVDGGTFTTGARGATVTVAPLCMDLTEVTVDAYVACIRTGLCTAAHVGEMSSLDAFRPDTACNHGVAGRGNHPMNCVDWAQSAAYCQSQASCSRSGKAARRLGSTCKRWTRMATKPGATIWPAYRSQPTPRSIQMVRSGISASARVRAC